MKFTQKVTALGRITIPKEIREMLRIEDGDFVILDLVEVRKKRGA